MNKIHLLTGLCLLALTSSKAQNNFYDNATIQDIKLTFTQSNWDYMLDTAVANGETYIMALSCEINGTIFDSVGVKYKGNSSYNANQNKNPLHIQLDAFKNQDYQGFDDIKLANGFSDPSFVREALSYEILSNYMHCPRANFARVWINGSYRGLYTNDESPDKGFMNDHFKSKNGVRVKCTPPGGAGPSSSAYPDLTYLGVDSSLYTSRYEMQSDFGWAELIDLTETLKNSTSTIESKLDVDRALWMLAFNAVLVNLDSYSGNFKQNYYLYRDEYDIFNPIVWDLNMSFGGFTQLGANSGMGTQLDSAGLRNLTYAPHINDSNWPLISKLLAIPTYKKQYIAHMKTIAEEMFTSQLFYTRGQAMQTLIDSSFNADPNKFYTTAKMHQNLISSVTGSGGGPGGGSVQGIKNLMDGRMSYLNSTAEFQAVAPTLGAITTAPTAPMFLDTLYITVEANNATSVTLGYRSKNKEHFVKTEMFDDGAHYDGIAGDGVYGVAVVSNSLKLEYYIYAENNNAGVFSPARAQHEFHLLTLDFEPVTAGSIVINEFLASNGNKQTDPSGEYEDWIELYNPTSNTIRLVGMYLSDDVSNYTKWDFPDTVTIAPNSYIAVWCDDDTDQPGLHANFKLSASGETITLAYDDTQALEQYTYGNQTTDVSMGRCANGVGGFIQMPTSFLTANDCTLSTEDLAENVSVTIYPNPANDVIYLSKSIEALSIYSLEGKLLHSIQQPTQELALSNTLADGVYILHLKADGNLRTQRLVIIH